jgi:site-specific recombinase XerD
MKIKDAFEGYLAYRREMGMKPITIAGDVKMLYGSFMHSIAERDLSTLKISDVADVIEAGRAHGEFGSQRSVSTLRKFFRYCDDTDIPTPFDWRDVEVPHVPRKINEYLTQEELIQVLESFDLTKMHGLRTRALCEVLIATGMRISEALSLNRGDINWGIKEATIINVKNGDQQTVNFTDRSLLWIKRYLDARADGEPYLFTAGKGRLPTVTARFYLREHTKKLGIKKHIKNHIFRKSFVTHLIEKGADLAMVSSLARHRDVRTTLRFYAAVNKERSKDVHTAIMNSTLKRVEADDGTSRP